MNNDPPVFDRPGPGLCLRICGTPWEGDGLRLVQNCPMYFLFCPLRQRGACSPVSEKTFQWWHKASIKFFDSKNTRKNWLYWSLRSRASSLGKGWAPQKPQTIGHFWGRLHFLIHLLIFRPKMFSCFSFSNSFFVPVSKSDVKKPLSLTKYTLVGMPCPSQPGSGLKQQTPCQAWWFPDDGPTPRW